MPFCRAGIRHRLRSHVFCAEAFGNLYRLLAQAAELIGQHCGIGHDTISSTRIANNLKYLNYEKTLAVSRLKDIPSRVLSVLQTG